MATIGYKGNVNPLEKYLKDVAAIRATGAGTDETSYYTPLNNLLDELGRQLKPRVKAVMQLKNLYGAGFPDGGLFIAPDQFQKKDPSAPAIGQKPMRGAIEAKPTDDDAFVTADSGQVSKYWNEYGQVLVTNYRDFVLVGRDIEGKPVKVGSYRMAPDEDAFWVAAAHPHKTAEEQGKRLLDFLKLAALSPATIVDPKDVAWILAYYAREARARGRNLAALNSVREALEEALGLKFTDEKGDHFFRSSLVQTLFYGIFSAWVLWSKENQNASDKFDWRLAQWSLKVPMIRVLFGQVATPDQLGALGLVEVLDWTAAALNRVDRSEFRKRFQEQHAVQYFYEPFLKAFDPELRKQLGVWFTPIEIVQYMVARADRVLREELKLADGLADKDVYILDPACGTGAYLVEVLKTIATTLKSKGEDALFAQKLKQIAIERVFGFELLPAPFVVAHLQLGLLLHNLGAPLSEVTDERPSVYLTNSLTGWEPPKGAKVQMAWKEMQAERDAADNVKRKAPILVVLGNPPYNAFAGISPQEEEGLVEVYKGIYWADKVNKKTGKTVKDKQNNPVKARRYRLSDPASRGGWGIKKFNLDDLYVRFFRLAERRIAEVTGRGVVCYISNHSYITEPSFVILREHLFNSFNKIWIENLHGDRKKSEYAPDGRTSETVFAMPGFSPGIKQGVATTLWVKTGEASPAEVYFRDDVDPAKATDRRQRLLETLNEADFQSHYKKALPNIGNRYSFWPSTVAPQYLKWPKIVDLCSMSSNGLMEKRGGALIDSDKLPLSERMQTYFNKELDWNDFVAKGHGLSKKYARFKPKEARKKALDAESFSEDRIVEYAVRPFDIQWCYYVAERPVWNEPRPQLWDQCWKGNWFVLTRLRAGKDPEGDPIYFTTFLSDDHIISPDAIAIPAFLRVQTVGITGPLLGNSGSTGFERVANLSEASRVYLGGLGLDPDVAAPKLWMHVLATASAPLYLSENADGVKRDWPRVPLPTTAELLDQSADLGLSLANLLNPCDSVKGVTTETIRPEIAMVGNLSLAGSGPLDPSTDLKLTKGWGHKGKNGINPGKGLVIERDYTPAEREAIAKGAEALGLNLEDALAKLGQETLDVYLNSRAYWKNVPAKVWGYYIGGYQVIKKWLSYREAKIIDRPLTVGEADHVRDIARRLTAICLMGEKLDANYSKLKIAAYTWPAVAPPNPPD